MSENKKEIIIHIGMHKTGTTSIQETLDENLNDPEFSYVHLSAPNHSKEIFTLFQEINHPLEKNTGSEKIKKRNLLTKENLINNFTRTRNKKLIISGESIRDMSKKSLIRFREFLREYFHQITIVAYIRAPKGYMESAFQQRIKDGKNSFDLERVYPYYKRFKLFDEVFGRENVKFWKFDTKTFPDGNVVLDFCRRLGITEQPKILITNNESLSKEALSLLYIYRKYRPNMKTNAAYYLLVKELSDIKGNRVILSPYSINSVLSMNRHDIRWMEGRLGESLEEEILPSEHSIKNEKDFLTISPEIIEKLKDIIGEEFLPNDIKVNTPKEVAELIHILYKKINNRKIPVSLMAIREKMYENNPLLLKEMNKKRISLISKEVFIALKDELENSDGTVNIPGVGKFSIHL